MARASPHGKITECTETRILDPSGNELCRTRYVIETTQDPVDGSINTIKRAESLTLTSGETWNVGMSAGPNPVLMAGVCDACQKLCNASKLRICSDCGIPLCSRHRRRSRRDGRWRCLKHHRLHKLASLFAALLFEECSE